MTSVPRISFGVAIVAGIAPSFSGLKELTVSRVQPALEGDLDYFGADYQLFVPWVRLLDPTQ